MAKNNYTQEVAFVNRDVEMNYLKAFFNKVPSELLFIYGPKSSGKTTLLYNVIEQINADKRFDIKYLNLREVWLGNYKNFIKMFFKLVDENEKKSKNLFEISAGIFKISKEIESKLLKVEADPFKVMKQDLIKLNKKGKSPIIIIDELQALQDIYMNGQRLLINELFNFFVAMTKESHLAHIIISSSDGYFIETIYEDSRLRKTSGFYKIDYLPKKDVLEWLNNLMKYSKINDLTLTEGQIEEIWDFVGGSCWEIQFLLSQIMISGFESAITKYKREKESDIINCVNKDLEREKILKGFQNNKFLSKKAIFGLTNMEFKKLGEMLSQLVSENILFFDPVEAMFSSQSKSIEYGIEKYFENVK